MWSPACLGVAGRGAPRGSDRVVISLRRMSLGSGYRYLMESVAVGDGGRCRPPAAWDHFEVSSARGMGPLLRQ